MNTDVIRFIREIRGSYREMKRYLLIVLATMAFVLLLLFAVEALGFSLLTDPTPWMRRGGVLAAV